MPDTRGALSSCTTGGEKKQGSGEGGACRRKKMRRDAFGYKSGKKT